MMRRRIAHNTQACTSNVKVTLRGQRSKLELFDRSVPCPACISTMHHRIYKKLGTNVHHGWGGVLRTRPRPELKMSRSHLHVKGWNEYYLKGMYLVRLTFQPCIIGFQRNLAQTFTMMRRHVTRKTQACTLKVKVTLTGKMSKWVLFDRTTLSACISNHAS